MAAHQIISAGKQKESSSSPTIITKFVSLSLIINDRLVRQIIWSAKTCIVKEGNCCDVLHSTRRHHNACSGTRIVGLPWKLNSTAKERGERNKSVLSKVQRPGAAEMGLGNFPSQTFIVLPPSPLHPPPPPTDDDPLLWSPPSFQVVIGKDGRPH